MTKKRIIALVIVAALVVAGVFGLNYLRMNTRSVYVNLVSDINNNWVLTENGSDGNITDADAQVIYVDSSATIAEVYVSEGDEVSVDTPLFRYDTQATQLELETAQADVASAKAALSLKNQTLALYQAIVPVAESNGENTEETTDVLTDAQKLPEAYGGEGTAESPLSYLCTEETVLTGEQINAWIYDGLVVSLEIREGNTLEGELLDQWIIDGSQFILVDDTSYWQVSTRSQYYPEVEEEEVDDGSGSYTQSEKNRMISEIQTDIDNLTSQIKQGELSVQKLQSQISESTVKATVPGVVKTIGDPEKINSSQAFCTISSKSGMVLVGYISELNYEDTRVGDKVSVTSWTSEGVSEATISEISDVPVSSDAYYSYSENPNSSHYQYKAILDDDTGFTIGDAVSVTPVLENVSELIVLEKMYVRTENGESYVMKDDGTGHLTKQVVTAEPTSQSEYVLVTDGLTNEDYIAYPYGKKAVEGFKTTTEYQISFF